METRCSDRNTVDFSGKRLGLRQETAGFASGNGHEPVQVKEAASEDTIWPQIIGRCGARSCVAVVVILPDHYRFSSGFSRFREEEYSVDKSCIGG